MKVLSLGQMADMGLAERDQDTGYIYKIASFQYCQKCSTATNCDMCNCNFVVDDVTESYKKL